MDTTRAALVVFQNHLPASNWWDQVNTVIGPESLADEVQARQCRFINIEALTEFDSVQEAAVLAEQVSRIELPDGRRISKLVTYKGYELWWIHYENLFHGFCLSYTQYRRLLIRLAQYPRVFLFNPPHSDLFRCFLEAHGCECVILAHQRPLGLLLKVLPEGRPGLLRVGISIASLILLKFRSPKVIVWTGDLLDTPHDYDFRLARIYEELRSRNIPFVEFIRSRQSFRGTLAHALRRRRPVIYSSTIIAQAYAVANWLARSETLRQEVFSQLKDASPEERFWTRVSYHAIANTTGTQWAIRVIAALLRYLNVTVAFIPGVSARTLHELLACKLTGVATVGIEHGAAMKSYLVSEYMPGYDGPYPMGTDIYGVWSAWWREYYRRYSKTFDPDQIRVSGYLRPIPSRLLAESSSHVDPGKLNVLFVIEPLLDPREASPYLHALLAEDSFCVHLKARPMIENLLVQWLRQNDPDVLGKVTVLQGSMHEAIAQCNVVVGSHSTGVLDGLLQLKPVVFFKTVKWKDYYGLKALQGEHHLSAENPAELVQYVRESVTIPQTTLKQLRNQFFGDPRCDGGRWVVDQIEHYLRYGLFRD